MREINYTVYELDHFSISRALRMIFGIQSKSSSDIYRYLISDIRLVLLEFNFYTRQKLGQTLHTRDVSKT